MLDSREIIFKKHLKTNKRSVANFVQYQGLNIIWADVVSKRTAKHTAFSQGLTILCNTLQARQMRHKKIEGYIVLS